MKTRGSPRGLAWKLCGWMVGEATEIPVLGVKFVYIRRKTRGEGGLLDDD